MKTTLTFEWNTDDVFIEAHRVTLKQMALQRAIIGLGVGLEEGDMEGSLYYHGTEEPDGEGTINYYGTWKIEES